MPPSRSSTSSLTRNCCPSCGAAGACSSRPLWRRSTTTSCACSPRTMRAATSTARSRSPAPRASRSPRPSSPSPRGRRWMATSRCWSGCWSCNSWRACLRCSYASGCSIPAGSHLLAAARLQGATACRSIPSCLGYPWVHGDPRVDALQRDLQALVARSEAQRLPRREVFAAVWQLSHEAAQRPVPATRRRTSDRPIPRLSEPWYCCAEPTDQQLQSF